MRRPNWLSAVVVTLLLAPTAHALTVTITAKDLSLDEAVVEGKLSRLQDMRTEMSRLEDLFYSRYNALNAHDDFDVHCARETRAGTRLESRTCRPVFESEILASEAIDYHRDLMLCCQMQTPLWLEPQRPPQQPVPASLLIDARMQDFRSTLLNVTRQNPELVQLLRDRAKVLKRYQATQRRLLGRTADR